MMGLMFYPSYSWKTNLNYDLKVNSSVALYITIICTCKMYNTILKGKSEHKYINICHVVHDFPIKVYNVIRIFNIILYPFYPTIILPVYTFYPF